MIRLTLRIPEDLHEYLRVQAFQTRESINGIIIQLLAKQVEAEKEEGKK